MQNEKQSFIALFVGGASTQPGFVSVNQFPARSPAKATYDQPITVYLHNGIGIAVWWRLHDSMHSDVMHSTLVSSKATLVIVSSKVGHNTAVPVQKVQDFIIVPTQAPFIFRTCQTYWDVS